MRRTMLFLPGNTPNMLINGDTLGADTIIFDLEDAVSPDEKDAARILVRNALKYQSFPDCEVVVRINPTDTEFWKEDFKSHYSFKTGCDYADKSQWQGNDLPGGRFYDTG